ncbi:MAG: SagB/ThcOx family dehydrogenase [Anaerolineae bacterium]|nr:SagB/ThcOx family dehydrogenase [Anaerolineae bacterium]
MEQPYQANAVLINLVPAEEFSLKTLSTREAINARRSHRKFISTPLTLEELSYLVWASQGVHEIWRDGIAVRRTVPSAGARHPFETYLAINNVESVQPGLYRYLSMDHKLCLLNSDPDMANRIAGACHHQGFISRSAVTFVWTAIPYRTEWRYSLMAPKLVNLDAGHVCQNLYIAATSIQAGMCAIAAYNQVELDALLGVDGEDEFAIYVAPVGKV